MLVGYSDPLGEDLFAKDFPMAHVLRGFPDAVHQDPSQGHRPEPVAREDLIQVVSPNRLS